MSDAGGSAAAGAGTGAIAGSAFGPWGTVIGGAIGALGGLGSAYLGSQSSEKGIKFQKKLAKRRYQWLMEDLRKAGLNPMLAIGGATPPGGGGTAAYEPPNIGASALEGASSAMALERQMSELDLLDAEIVRKHEEIQKTTAEGWNAHWQSKVAERQYQIMAPDATSAKAVDKMLKAPGGETLRQGKALRDMLFGSGRLPGVR